MISEWILFFFLFSFFLTLPSFVVTINRIHFILAKEETLFLCAHVHHHRKWARFGIPNGAGKKNTSGERNK